jgi:hypothetical protein
MQALRRVPQRCRSCQNRFYTYLSPTADENHKDADDHKVAGDPTTPADQTEIR